jgi:hypothetical protein
MNNRKYFTSALYQKAKRKCEGIDVRTSITGVYFGRGNNNRLPIVGLHLELDLGVFTSELANNMVIAPSQELVDFLERMQVDDPRALVGRSVYARDQPKDSSIFAIGVADHLVRADMTALSRHFAVNNPNSAISTVWDAHGLYSNL